MNPLTAGLYLCVGLGLLCIGTYASYLIVNTLRFWRLRSPTLLPDTALPTVCVVVPARNEAAHIAACLRAILVQDYPPDKLEIIVVDDHSTDDTAAIAQQIINLQTSLAPSRFRLLRLDGPETNAMKKLAIGTAIEATDAEVIVCTDADSAPASPLWLRTLCSAYTGPDVAAVAGPVRMRTANSGFSSWFTDFQAFESGGLVAIAAGNIAGGSPMMVNGANLSYRRSAYLAVNGFTGLTHVASGDDELLIHKIARQQPGCVRFVRSVAAIVDTEPCHTWPELRRQRIRWVSKAPAYKHPWMTAMQLAAYLAKLAVVLSLFSLLVWPQNWPYMLGAVVVHALPELWALGSAAVFMQRPRLTAWFPVIFWVYIVYVLWVGAISPFVKNYEWKGRAVR